MLCSSPRKETFKLLRVVPSKLQIADFRKLFNYHNSLPACYVTVHVDVIASTCAVIFRNYHVWLTLMKATCQYMQAVHSNVQGMRWHADDTTNV